jgi:methylglutaconyl-CoA hydratase
MLEVERDGGRLTLRLARPEIGNAFDANLATRLGEALDAAAADDTVRVVVIAGAGRHFSAGADLVYMQHMRGAGREANAEDARRTQRLFARIAEFPKPVVARVHGAARGGGVGVVAAVDVAVASTAASFAFTEVRLGIVPAMIAPFVLERLGPARGRRLFLTGETFGAAEALAWGLVDTVTAPEELDAAVDQVIGHLLRGGPMAQREVKRLVADVRFRGPEQTATLTADRIAELRVSDEGQEGMAAFLEKRAPRWIT